VRSEVQILSPRLKESSFYRICLLRKSFFDLMGVWMCAAGGEVGGSAAIAESSRPD
jgi:hypothetical protein